MRNRRSGGWVRLGLYGALGTLLTAGSARADWIDTLIDTGNRLVGITADAPSRRLQRRAVEYAVYGGDARFDAMKEAATQLVEGHAPDAAALQARLTHAVGRGLAEMYQGNGALEPDAKASFDAQLAEARRAFTTTAELSRADKGRAVNWFCCAGPRAFTTLIDIARRGRQRAAAISTLGTMARDGDDEVRQALLGLATGDPDAAMRQRAALALQAMDLADAAATIVDHEAEFYSPQTDGDMPGDQIGVLPVGTPVTVLHEVEGVGPGTWNFYRVRVIATGREGLMCPAYLLDDRYIWAGY